MDGEYDINELDSKSAVDVYNDCKEAAKLQDTQKKGAFRINELKELNGIMPFEVRSLALTPQYKGLFPTLESFPYLQEFQSFVAVPIRQYTKLDMSKIKDLYITVSDMEDIEIAAPCLRKLEIYINHNPVEMQLQEQADAEPRKILNVSGAPLIQDLKLYHFEGYDLTWVGCLSDLRSLCITYTRVNDLSWLASCMKLEALSVFDGGVQIQTLPALSGLKQLSICGCALESIYGLPFFPNLSYLNLEYNNIKEIESPEIIEHIRTIVLRKNPVAGLDGISGIRRGHLILNDTDKTLSVPEMERVFGRIFQRAYRQSVNEYNHLDQYPSFIHNKILNSTIENRFEQHVNEGVREEFFGLSPDRTGLNDYNTVEKEALIEYAEENYSFIEITDEYRQQIEYENLGIQTFFEEGCGHILYANHGIFCITAQFNSDIEKSEIHFIYPDRKLLRWSDVMKFMDPKGQNDIFQKYYFRIEIFDLYRTGNAQNLSLGVRAAIESLLKGLMLASDTFVAGEYSTIGKVKRDPISERWIPLSAQNGAKRIINISKGKAGTRYLNGVQWLYGVDFDGLS